MEALHEQRDWLLVTLSCIGDAVITTGLEGRVTFLNPVAESLTGWTARSRGAATRWCDSISSTKRADSRSRFPPFEALREGRTV